MGHRQAALPAGIARVLLGQPPADGEVLGVCCLRRHQLALGLQHVAHLGMGRRQLALPTGIAGVLLGQPPADGKVLGVCRLRRRQLALGLQHVAHEALGVGFDAPIRAALRQPQRLGG
jgi:hypothetical protein